MTPLNHHTNLPPTSQLLGCGGEINFRLVEVPAPGDCCHTRWHLTVPDSPLFPSASSSSATLHSPSPLLNTFVPSPHVPLHLLPFFWRTLLQSHRPFSLTAWGWGRGGSFPSIFIHTPHPPTPDPQPPPHHPRSVWSRYPASPGSRSEEQTLQRYPPPQACRPGDVKDHDSGGDTTVDILPPRLWTTERGNPSSSYTCLSFQLSPSHPFRTT